MKRFFNLFLKSNDILLETFNKDRVYRKLNQDISFIHGTIFHNFILEVPKDVEELIKASGEMHNHMYRYEDAIINNKVQIVNFVKDGKRHYSVVLRMSRSKISIIEFKGVFNDDTMETSDEGYSYQIELLLLIVINRDKIHNKNTH